MKKTILSVTLCASVAACGGVDETTGSPNGLGILDGGADGSFLGLDATIGDFQVDGSLSAFDASTVDANADIIGKADDSCGSIEGTSEVARAPVDIVLALDTSGSMFDEMCNVGQNLQTFADGVGETSHVVAAYNMASLGILTWPFCGTYDPLADTTLSKDPQRYLHADIRVNSNDALQRLLDGYDNYAGFLRSGAPTHFIVVSDDESDLAASAFQQQMEAKLGHPFYFHAIVPDGQNGCRGSAIGQQYLDLADATGGVKLPICATDWSGLFTQLQAAVVATATLPCDFAIPDAPLGTKVDTSMVSVFFTPAGGASESLPLVQDEASCSSNTAWYFDDPLNPTRMLLCPATCDATKQSAKLNIAFGCEPPTIN